MSVQNEDNIQSSLISYFDFLHYATPSVNDQLSFAAKITLFNLQPIHLSVYEKNHHREVEKLGHWGSDLKLEKEPGNSLLKIIEDAILNISSEFKIETKKTLMQTTSYSHLPNSVSLIALPANENKCLIALTRIEPTKNELFLLKAIASLISLRHKFERKKSLNSGVAIEGEISHNYPPHELTSRQKLIYDAMVKGYTNRRISEEIGFSESLVRQETVRIFKYFNVSGRNELLKGKGA